MKRIINGKTYNTETAKLVGEYWNGLGDNDFRSLSEGLYLSKKGQYFIAGEGGPLTKYALEIGNQTSGSSSIELISKEEAMEWAEKNLTIDEYIAEFGEIEG